MAIQVRRGNEVEFDPAKMLPGEWAVSLDTKYVRMCFAPGECLRMATYEAFEQDMEEIIRILAECRDIKTAVELIRDNVTEAELVIEDYVAQAKQYRDEAEQFRNEAFATTPEGYADLVQNVADNTVKIDTIIEKAELNIKNTATGKTIHLTDSADSKVVEFGLYGKAEQKQYSGKNLLKYPYYHTTQTVNGITYTDIGDGRIMANGTATERSGFTLHTRSEGETNEFILPNGEYIFTGCPAGGSASTYRINFGITKDGSYSELGSDRGNGAAFTAEGDDFSTDSVNLAFAIDILAGVTVSNLIFEPMIRLASITDGTYEPYVGGIASPSPDYPQDVEVAGASGSIEVVSLGKNLIPYPYYETTHTQGGITFTDLKDGRVMANGVHTATVDFIFQFRQQGIILKPGTYKVSGCPKGGSTTSYYITINTFESSDRIAVDFGNGATFTLDKETMIGVFAHVRANYTANNLVFEPMISIDGGEYEPYTETTATISTPDGFPGIPVDSGGNYTDENGQQWISDEIVKYADGSGKRIQRVDVKVLDGVTHKASYYVAITGDYGDSLVQINLSSDNVKVFDESLTPYVLCNKARANTSRVPNTIFLYRYSDIRSIPVLLLEDTGEITSLSTANTWLASNPVTVLYALATPIETDLTAEEVAEIEKLHTFYPVTNISNDAGCGMEVTYLADAKNYIDNRLALIESAMINNI